VYETWIRLYEACKCRRVSQRTWSLSTEQSHSIDEHLYSPYDHGRRSRGTGDLERGTLMQIVPQILSYRYKNERSVAFKIRQNPFSTGAVPRSAPDPTWGTHNAPPDPLVGWRGDTPPHIPPHSVRTHFRRSPCVPQKSSQIYAMHTMSHKSKSKKKMELNNQRRINNLQPTTGGA